ncbi:hypothetical protein EVG20_g9125 [Dentipellis fragilis]|uniref:Uncharacterized protein n=1 Tax=Dentipellis fragilis TaxID=205917 RepID=A0A4Y9Y1J7_9AGAM|nr:hypothetical protein EVG20_g9125 [Dentipellis fragilis]
MKRTPLADLPLERFLPASTDANIPRHATSPFKQPGSNKRPLSPTGPTPFSPAKRRILEQEGLLSPPKTPLSSSSSRSSGRFAPTYFHDLVKGPDSPARKLDFKPDALQSASAGGSRSPSTPSRTTRHTSDGRTRTSPRLVAKSSARQASQSPPTPQPSSASATPASASAPAPAASPAGPSTSTPLMIPREMPPPPDRLSMHYPGFDVHQDTHIPLLRASDVMAAPEPAPGKEEEKENLPPRRRVRKAATEPTTLDGKKALDGKRAKSTPRGLKERNEADDATPRRSARLGTSAASAKRSAAQERRRMMEDEVDGAGSDEENIAL